MINLSPQTINPTLDFKQIQDQYVRRNFENLSKYFSEQNQLLNFKFFEVVFDKANANYVLTHALGYVPQDVVMVNCVGSGEFKVNFGQGDSKKILLSATGALRARFFLGTYWNKKSSYNFANTDSMTFNAVPNTTFVTNTTQVTNNITIITGSTVQTITPGSLAKLDSSSGAFSITLPLASSANNTSLLLVKVSNDFNQITLNTQGTDVINGSLSSTTLSTQNEYLVLVPTGGGYYVQTRYIDQSWKAYPSTAAGTLITGSGSNPSYGTVVQNNASYRRVGNTIEVRWNYRQTTAGGNGTGTISFRLPSTLLSWDTNFLPTLNDSAHPHSGCGYLWVWANAFSVNSYEMYATGTNGASPCGGGFSNSNTTSVNSGVTVIPFAAVGNASMTLELKGPITGWAA